LSIIATIKNLSRRTKFALFSVNGLAINKLRKLTQLFLVRARRKKRSYPIAIGLA